jgi:hypothetical protein
MKKKMVMFIALIALMSLANVLAEKIEIDIKESGQEKLVFNINLYNDNNEMIEGAVEYKIENYYLDLMKQGSVNSKEDVIYELPDNPVQGPWKITAKYKDYETNELFNVGDLKRAKILLEGDNLIIKNTGNIVYDRKLLIWIGDNHQTADLNVAVGETKNIKLTAPAGEYTITVDDGTEKEDLVFNEVSLTGNVIGIQAGKSGNFFEKYPLVSLFLVTLIVVSVIVFGMRYFKK